MFSSKNKHRKMQDPLSFTFCWGETFDTVPFSLKHSMTCGRTRRSAPTTSYSYLFDTTDALPLDTIRASLYNDVFTIRIMLNLLYIRVPKLVPLLELFSSKGGTL